MGTVWLSSTQITQLNRIGQRQPPDTPENRGAYRKWKEDVWIFLFENYVKVPDTDDRVIDDDSEIRAIAVEKFCAGLHSFCSEKGSLANYALRALKVNVNENSADMGRKHGDLITDSTVKIDSDGEETEVDIPTPANNEANLFQEAVTSQMTAMILNFWSLFQNSKAKKSWSKYFPMWYSEKTKYLQECGCRWENTADVVRALDFDYLGFFLFEDFSKREFQTWMRFCSSDLKKAISSAKKGGQIDVVWTDKGWLPTDVPQTYLYESGKTPKVLANSVITEQRQNYLRELRRLLCENDLMEA